MTLAVFGYSTPVFVVGYLLAMCSRCNSTGCRCRASPRSPGLVPFLRNLIFPRWHWD